MVAALDHSRGKRGLSILDHDVLVLLLQHTCLSQDVQLVCQLLCTCNRTLHAAISSHLRGAVPLEFQPRTPAAVASFSQWLVHHAALSRSIKLDLTVLKDVDRYYSGILSASLDRLGHGLAKAQGLRYPAAEASTTEAAVQQVNNTYNLVGRSDAHTQSSDAATSAQAEVSAAVQQRDGIPLQSFHSDTLSYRVLQYLPPHSLTSLVIDTPFMAHGPSSSSSRCSALAGLTSLRQLSFHGAAADALLSHISNLQQLTTLTLGGISLNSVQYLAQLPVTLKCLRFCLAQEDIQQHHHGAQLPQQADHINGPAAANEAAELGVDHQLQGQQDAAAAGAADVAAPAELAAGAQPQQDAQQEQHQAGAAAAPAADQQQPEQQLQPGQQQLAINAEQTPILHLTALTELGTLNAEPLDFVEEDTFPCNLQVLDVADCTPAKALYELQHLRALKLTDNSVTAEELSAIATHCTQLTQVDLGYHRGARYAAAAAPGWQKLPVKSLAISGMLGNLTSNMLQHLGRMTGLTGLHLQDMVLTARIHELTAAVGQLTALSKLQLKDLIVLDVLAAGGSVRGLWVPICSSMATLPALCCLQLTALAPLGDEEGEQLATSVGKLTALQLLRCDLSSFALVALLTSDACRGLQRLEVRWNNKLRDVVCPVIAGLSHLTHLDMSGTAISDTGVRALCRLTGLQHLVLSSMSTRSGGVTDAVLLNITEQLTNLSHLALNDTQVTGPCLGVLRRLRKLKHLSVLGCGITVDEKLNALRFDVNRMSNGLSPDEWAKMTAVLPSGVRPGDVLVDDVDIESNVDDQQQGGSDGDSDGGNGGWESEGDSDDDEPMGGWGGDELDWGVHPAHSGSDEAGDSVNSEDLDDADVG